AVADTRYPMGAPSPLRDEWAFRRLDRIHPDGGLAPFQRASDAADPPAGTLGRHHRIDPSPGLFPDLFAGGSLRLGIVGVLELGRHEVSARLARDHGMHLLHGYVDIRTRPGRQHELRAVALDHLLAL